MLRIFGCFILLCGFNSFAAVQQIKTIYELQNSPHRELVEYALQVTAQDFGAATLVFVEATTQGRVEQLLRAGELLDLAVFAPNLQREKTLLPVYFPLSRGLLGFRVCLINQGQQQKFDKIHSVDDWIKAEILIGQGANWPDVEVLRANNLQVTTNPLPALLFEMLRQQRFDCYARGINEINYELALPESAGLQLESKLLLFYPQPAMLFVAPNQPELARRLLLGLEHAWHSGFMAQHFATHYGSLIKQVQCEQRRLLILKNPALTPETEQAMRIYALTPLQIQQKPLTGCVPEA
ncbi:hypothetical protein GCM10010919_01670 [Alishewanella longhuensis]|uniref:Solute-binding protein family 3/N-terminal domain-containing protein n=1 Tax=Alishewanella longhuensis TaxID=1091037 RepID=A0ABQ3KT38_9ALTE|nr:hypothetical protein [Alishewanella longhuensis]GHG59279.1 hypothetical protein GCM10010919_01670 [Alishewanella longhuensis]